MKQIQKGGLKMKEEKLYCEDTVDQTVVHVKVDVRPSWARYAAKG